MERNNVWGWCPEAVQAPSEHDKWGQTPFANQPHDKWGQTPFANQPQQSAHQQNALSDTQVRQALYRLNLQSNRRAVFAQTIFPYNHNFGSRGKWAKAVGRWVATDIKSDPRLRQQMNALGYHACCTGYTEPQLLALVRYYMEKGIVR